MASNHGTTADEERLDIVSATGRHLGVAGRAEIHEAGHWHQVFHCLVVRSGRPARVVLQRRHQSKRAFPGLLDLSATGHLDAGERPIDGVRELEEELGVLADPDDLVPVGVRLLADDGGEGRNRERVHLYFLTDDRPLDRFSPAVDEVDGLVEAAAADLLTLVGPRDEGGPAPSPIRVRSWRPGEPVVEADIGRDDLVGPADGYWTLVLLMAERHAAGIGPLAI